MIVENPATFAAETGFTGERATDTWRKRMRRLRELGFTRSKPGPSGDFHFILLMNPNIAVETMRRDGQVQDGLYGRFIERLADVGAAGDWPAHQEALEAAVAKAAAARPEAVSKANRSNKGAK